jgi:hypothetical protein
MLNRLEAEDERESLFGTEFAIVIYQLSSATRLAEKVFGNQELNSVASLDEMPTRDSHQRFPPEMSTREVHQRPELSTAGRVWILVVTAFPRKAHLPCTACTCSL